MLAKIWKAVDSVLFCSIFELRRANEILYKKTKNNTINQFESDDRLNVSIEKLFRELENTIERIERIEDKANRTLLGITIAIAILGVASTITGPSGMFSHVTVVMRIVLSILLILIMVYLFTSGFLSLQAYKIGEIYRPTLLDYPPITNPGTQAKVLLYCIEQNRVIAMVRSNRLSASFSCLRNGLGSILLFGVLIITFGSN